MPGFITIVSRAQPRTESRRPAGSHRFGPGGYAKRGHIILELANRENNGRDSANDTDSPNQ